MMFFHAGVVPLSDTHHITHDALQKRPLTSAAWTKCLHIHKYIDKYKYACILVPNITEKYFKLYSISTLVDYDNFGVTLLREMMSLVLFLIYYSKLEVFRSGFHQTKRKICCLYSCSSDSELELYIHTCRVGIFQF